MSVALLELFGSLLDRPRERSGAVVAVLPVVHPRLLRAVGELAPRAPRHARAHPHAPPLALGVVAQPRDGPDIGEQLTALEGQIVAERLADLLADELDGERLRFARDRRRVCSHRFGRTAKGLRLLSASETGCASWRHLRVRCVLARVLCVALTMND